MRNMTLDSALHRTEFAHVPPFKCPRVPVRPRAQLPPETASAFHKKSDAPSPAIPTAHALSVPCYYAALGLLMVGYTAGVHCVHFHWILSQFHVRWRRENLTLCHRLFSANEHGFVCGENSRAYQPRDSLRSYYQLLSMRMQQLSTPDLFLRLLVQPGGPLVGDKLVLKTVLLGQLWDEGFEFRRKEVVEQPEFD